MVVYYIEQNNRLSNHFQKAQYMYVNTLPRDTLDTPGQLGYPGMPYVYLQSDLFCSI